jgi:hypothetical protein
VALLLAMGTTLLAGCNNPFSPAKAQPPVTDSGAIVVPTDYATREGTFTTIAQAISAKGEGNGQAAYIGAFADTTSDGFGFTVEFDPSVITDRQQAGKAIPRWTRPLEAAFYRYLFTPAASPAPEAEYSLDWSSEGSDDIDETAGIATLYRIYDVKALRDDGTTLQAAYGHATLTMRRTAATSRWVITHWEDHVDPRYGADPPGDQSGFRSFSRIRIDSTGQ